MAKGKGGFLGQDGLNAPNQATGVSATAGDTSATVSFTAPSDTGASAITGYSVQSNNGDGTIPAGLASASYDGISFSVAGQVSPAGDGVHFKSDGTKMYVMSAGDNTVYQYSLSTAWDVSTASYDSVSLSVSSQDTGNWRDLDFSHDGTTLYCLGGNEVAYQYNLSSAWDLSTASYASKSFNFSSYNLPQGIFVSSDSTKVIICSSNTSAVWEFTLSTAKDISTASYTGNTKDLTGEDSGTAGVSMNSDGTVMVILGTTNDTVYLYNLSTAYDVSTASYSGTSLSVASQTDGADQIFLSQDSIKLYMIGDEVVYQYTTNLGGYPTSSPVTVTGLTNGTSYTFNVWAINASGWSAPSVASDAVSPVADLAVFMGGSFGSSPYVSSVIDYVNISTTGSASNWGSLTVARGGAAPASNSTRGIAAAGGNIYITQIRNTIDYITFSSTGNAVDFGDTTVARYYRVGGISNDTRGIFISGRVAGPNASQTTDYVTIATTGNATDYGNYGINLREGPSGCSSTTRGVSCGGLSESNVQYNNIRYTTIATVGSYSDFGDLSSTSYRQGAASNGTRAIFSGIQSSNKIEYVTIATTGNATDFGDLTVSQAYHEATSNKTRGIMAMSNGGSAMSLDYVNIATTGNASDFGSLSTNRYAPAAVGNNHGGVS